MTFTTYSQNFEDVLLWRALKDQKEGFYIDVGAWDPDIDSVTRAFSDRGWRGINIEPVAAFFHRLVASRPRDVNLQVAVGDKAGVNILYEVIGSGLSTLMWAQAEEYAAAGLAIETRSVEVATLSDICRQHAQETIHFLKLDCESSERAALLGADFMRFRPWIVLVEATAPNSTQEVHADWEDILVAAEYRFVWFDGLNRFYVAAEHHGRLAPLIALPPNIFDKFVHPPVPTPFRPVDPLIAATPQTLDVEQRIALAARCRDCDDVPKVADAGRVLTQHDGTRVQIMHNGLKVMADGYCGEWMTRLISRCRGHHEPQEERIFDQLVRTIHDDATMIELGSNWAYYSAWFLQGKPGRRAVLIEPDPANRAVGERNLALNGLQTTVLSGIVGRCASSPSPFQTERSGLQLLPCYTVPQLLAEYKIGTLDILHCDVQGAEYEVLCGCRELFRAGRINWVVISTHVHQISRDPLTHQRCLALLREDGAVVEVEHNPYESFTGDGLIVARLAPAHEGWNAVPITFARQDGALFREPVFDLAEASYIARDDHMRNVVRDSFQAVLMRDPEPETLAGFSQQLAGSRSILDFLQYLLRSPESIGNRTRFETTYFGEPPVQLVPSGANGSPFVHCSQVDLVFDHDTALALAGETLSVPNDRVILPAILRDGCWSVDDLRLLRERIDPERSYMLLDIGANIGLFSRQALNAFSNISTCHCIEADPANYAALARNLSAERFSKAKLHSLALGARDDNVAFFRDQENCGNYSCHPDAMRDRPHQTTSVNVRNTEQWMEENITPVDLPILWKSDTQGGDETIVAATPWPVWHRVEFALIELWRIKKDSGMPEGFLERVADMPCRRIGEKDVTVADVQAYLEGEDWAHENLLLWRDNGRHQL